MKSKITKIIVFSVVFILIAGIAVFNYLSSRVVYNEDNVTGNTTGNLNNKGLFCEYDGTIYFSNPSDNGCLYSMNLDCTNVRKLNNDSASSINVAGNYIYYIRDNVISNNTSSVFRGLVYGVIRTKLDGSAQKSLYDHLAGVITLHGNYIYYQSYSPNEPMAFCKVKIDGSDDTKLSDAAFFPSCYYDNYIYFPNVATDRNIYRYSIQSGITSEYLDANAYLIDRQGHYMYYIDLDNQYRLVRVDITTGDKEFLTSRSEGRCINFNIYEDKIFYYVEGDESALYRINLDGSDSTLVMNGNITSINCTSRYTFFQLFGSDALYRVPTKGSILVEQIVLQ